jgi:predicted secreted protein
MDIKGNSMFLRKITIISVIFLIGVFGPAQKALAGDVASFVDLGFSPDGRTYMFGQYGVLSPSLMPWAEYYIVDVGANNFVPNGKGSFKQNSAIQAGQDGSGVFYQLISNNSSHANRHGINFQNQGLPLYISRDENPPANGETIEFRDFIGEKAYKAQLVPYVEGSGRNIRSSFYINLESRAQNGQVRNYTVGTPHLKRPEIVTYNIKRVLIDGRGESIIFVIEMKRLAPANSNGYDVRYMVEAQRL